MRNIKWHETSITRAQRASLKNQKPFVFWLTGLSGSGKSTLANALEARLFELHKHTILLDGDNIRHGLCKDLGFKQEDRVENIRRIGEVAKLFLDAGIIVICAFVSPFEKDREKLRELLSDSFIEIFVDTPIEVCKKRDPKGLYQKAKKGELKDFSGLDSVYEKPKKPELHIDNSLKSIKQNVDIILEYFLSKIS